MNNLFYQKGDQPIQGTGPINTQQINIDENGLKISLVLDINLHTHKLIGDATPDYMNFETKISLPKDFPKKTLKKKMYDVYLDSFTTICCLPSNLIDRRDYENIKTNMGFVLEFKNFIGNKTISGLTNVDSCLDDNQHGKIFIPNENTATAYYGKVNSAVATGDDTAELTLDASNENLRPGMIVAGLGELTEDTNDDNDLQINDGGDARDTEYGELWIKSIEGSTITLNKKIVVNVNAELAFYDIDSTKIHRGRKQNFMFRTPELDFYNSNNRTIIGIIQSNDGLGIFKQERTSRFVADMILVPVE